MNTSNTSNGTATFHHAHPAAVKNAWYALQILGGQVLLPLVLITMILSSNVRRDPTLINLVVVWIAYSIFSCLLLYAGQAEGPEPSLGLCITQASLLYGAIPMLNAAAFGVVFQIWYWLRTISYDKTRDPERTKIRTDLLVTAPYVVLLAFVIASAVVGARSPHLVSRGRDFFYCSIQSDVDAVAGLVCVLISLGTLGLEIWTAIMLKHKWASTITDLKLPHTLLAFNVRIVKRFVIFSIFCIGVYGSTLFSLSKHPDLALIFSFMTALMPFAVFLIFGTQWSILRVWCFWIPRKPRSEVDTTSPLDTSPIRDSMLKSNRAPDWQTAWRNSQFIS